MKKAANKNLHNAKKAKNDEFYTRYEDIEKEIFNYKDHLKGKWIYSPCDDYRWSNFKVYFKEHFEELGLKHYTCTCYDIGDGAWRYDYDGEKETITKLEENGDFRSEECIKLLKECDAVITNPPFSLFREFVAQLMEYGKKFLIIGNGNAVTYKEIFPLFKENKIWFGNKSFSSGMDMLAGKNYDPNKCKHPKYDERGNLIISVMMCGWFTNVEHSRRNSPITLYKTYSADEYPKYDNYEAIEVSKVSEIPMDYDGVMGVPITFIDKYCPTQFEIIGITENAEYLKPLYLNGCEKYDRPYVNGKRMYSRLLIRRI